MTSTELKKLLVALELTQADFSRLIGMTPRAVNLWMTDVAREVPGPAAAYARLLVALPPNLRQVEFSRLKEGGTAMRDGMFGVTYRGQAGAGMAVLIFDSGHVYGTDVAKARYDGGYVFNESTGMVDVTIKVTFPPHVTSVLGIVNPYEWSIDVKTTFDPRLDSGHLNVATSVGQMLQAQFTFMRALPEAA
jgi:hypothetical protein